MKLKSIFIYSPQGGTFNLEHSFHNKYNSAMCQLLSTSAVI